VVNIQEGIEVRAKIRINESKQALGPSLEVRGGGRERKGMGGERRVKRGGEHRVRRGRSSHLRSRPLSVYIYIYMMMIGRQ
jgi:hypothetical protein